MPSPELGKGSAPRRHPQSAGNWLNLPAGLGLAFSGRATCSRETGTELWSPAAQSVSEPRRPPP